MFKYLPVNFYKPTKSIKGSMLQLTVKPAKTTEENGKTVNSEGFVYLSFAPQVGEKKFDYDKKVVLKLNAIECADIFKSLSSKKPTKLFHKTDTRTISLGLETVEDTRNPGEFLYNLSGNMNDKNGSQGFYYRLDGKEAEVVKTVLQNAIIEIFRAEV